jgi:hypothetical protein
VTVSQQKLLSVLRQRVGEIDESTRVQKYQKHVLSSLAEIVALERQHSQSAIQIQKKINDQCEALGQILLEGKWRPQ